MVSLGDLNRPAFVEALSSWTRGGSSWSLKSSFGDGQRSVSAARRSSRNGYGRAVDPEQIILLPVVAVLAILGARRRAETSSPTRGERVERAATGAAERLGYGLGAVVGAPSNATGALMRSTRLPTTGALAAGVESVGRAAGTLTHRVTSVAGRSAGGPVGLIVDGGAVAMDFLGGLPAKMTGARRESRSLATETQATAVQKRAHKRATPT